MYLYKIIFSISYIYVCMYVYRYNATSNNGNLVEISDILVNM